MTSCFSVAGCTTSDCFLGAGAGGDQLVIVSATGLPTPIVDNMFSDTVIPVAATGTIRKMVVGWGITHTFDADVDIFLAAPGQPLPGADICTDNGGGGDNFTGTFMRDNVATAVTSGTAPFTGAFRPETPLSTFNGLQVNGNWNLRVGDDAGGDTGTLNSAVLAFCVTP